MFLLTSSVCGLFKWRQFERQVILLAVGWYLRFSLSYRDVSSPLHPLRFGYLSNQSGQCIHTERLDGQKTNRRLGYSSVRMRFP